ncbi:MAG: carbohydrate-binding protein [Vicinamibacterales bacterium]
MTSRGITARLRAWSGMRGLLPLTALVVLALVGTAGRLQAAAADIVLYASDVTSLAGNWRIANDSTAAGGKLLQSDDNGFKQTDTALASPSHYFEIDFDAPAGTPYHVWLRLRARGNSKWNDSVWLQFSDAVNTSGSAAYGLGSGSGLLVNLEPCSNCGVSGWGWMDGAYWLQSAPVVSFASGGTHRLRVQTREDGVEIDQVVLSPATYLSNAPGAGSGDATIVAKGSGGASSPFYGSAQAVPGTIQVRDYDLGGADVAFHDTTAGNSGGAYRSDDVDLQSSADGGHNVGWFAAGEWMKYSVNVATAGTYTATLRVASPNTGTTVRLMFDGNNASATGEVPKTGDWQTWRDLQIPVTLQAGPQVMTLRSDLGGFNVSRVTLALVESNGGSGGGSGSGALAPYGGTPVALPGTVQAERYDEGGAGVAYGDATAGNSGGQFRADDVDIEKSGEGGYNIGWTDAGEWLNYTVQVASAGSYTVGLRVSSTAGGTMHVGFNGPSSVWQSVSIPNTGSWQKWTTVNLPVSLGAGTQQMTVRFDTGKVNLHHIAVTAGTSTPQPPASGGSSDTFRMMTWNIQHGEKKNGSYDPRAQAQFIASQHPDVVALQEVQTWDENQPEKYRSLLEEFTGDNWTLQWAPVNSKSSTEGNILLIRLPVISSTYHQMHATSDWDAMYVNRSVAQATIAVGGRSVHVFSTHVDYYSTSARTLQVADLMDWSAGFGGPRIVGGDFNSWWGESWIKSMMTEYTDTWQDVTGSNQNGYTVNNAVRFDYLFRAKTGASQVTPIKCFVPVTDLSDHNPVVADYRVQ